MKADPAGISYPGCSPPACLLSGQEKLRSPGKASTAQQQLQHPHLISTILTLNAEHGTAPMGKKRTHAQRKAGCPVRSSTNLTGH